MGDDELLTLRQVASMLGMSRHTMRRWAEKRRIPSFKLGRSVRIRRRDLEGFLARQRREAVAGAVIGDDHAA
jgi:excisionase family DNA binding protein